VEVRAGNEYLDIPDIDVDYSMGKLSKERSSSGRFELTYTADQVESDTTGFIKITASRSGYNTGYREIQFQIRDVGDVTVDDDDEGLLSGNLLITVLIIAFLVLLVVVIVFIIRRKRNKAEETEQYEEVQIAEIVDDEINNL
jgi:hypothetical protein